MLASKFNSLRTLLSVEKATVVLNQAAGFKFFPAPPPKRDIEFPERCRLKVVEKVPQYPPQIRPFKMQKRLKYMRGPETVHKDFIHKQFGIIANGGGRMRYVHFEMVRMHLLRHLDLEPGKFFAIWRVDPPWQPVTKKSIGQRMGGGKGNIDHYVTPIKAGRVIVEVVGHGEFFEVEYALKTLARKLPFKAEAISWEDLLKKRKEERELVENNINPYTWKYIIQNNMGGCHKFVSKNDKRYFGKFL